MNPLAGRCITPIGTWISADGRMRVRIEPDGSFEELRTDTGRTYRGTYRVDGTRIHFRDPDTGYEGSGEFRADGVMYADGVEFRRE